MAAERDQTTPLTATELQVKAVANSTRLRILRLCNDREWTNKELADRLDLDPSTVLHHTRLLTKAGLLEAVAVRQGPSGAYEKPYRSTGLSWKLSFDQIVEDDDASGESAMLNAFRSELREAGNNSITEMTRFHLHLDDRTLAKFIDGFKALVAKYANTDTNRRDHGQPGFGGMFIIHRLAETPDNDPR